MTWPQVSKAVGWDPRTVPWPTLAHVEDAITRKNAIALLTWNRFLEAAPDDEKRAIIKRVVEGLEVVRRTL